MIAMKYNAKGRARCHPRETTRGVINYYIQSTHGTRGMFIDNIVPGNASWPRPRWDPARSVAGAGPLIGARGALQVMLT